MKFKKLLLFIFIIPLVSFTLHKYYISLCEIDYIENKQTIQITMGLFIDDIEFTLNKDNNTELYLATNEEIESIDEIYESYLNNNFIIIVNNEQLPYQFIGKEYDDDLVRFYLEISDVPKLNSIEVKNTCLIRDFNDQQNIIKINANKKQKTFYLDNKTDKGLLKF
ncbi:DUF6702 family protein [uncultured Lutibacter sp.]|uniref:DUF6702 family protein n=1 Tax=uncultured Lutibacter sp. TaxID=437739 RepID=UPI0026118977|nr:DUF6702 family protein [uncultured Lutibacter sp.]